MYSSIHTFSSSLNNEEVVKVLGSRFCFCLCTCSAAAFRLLCISPMYSYSRRYREAPPPASDTCCNLSLYSCVQSVHTSSTNEHKPSHPGKSQRTWRLFMRWLLHTRQRWPWNTPERLRGIQAPLVIAVPCFPDALVPFQSDCV